MYFNVRFLLFFYCFVFFLKEVQTGANSCKLGCKQGVWNRCKQVQTSANKGVQTGANTRANLLVQTGAN
jgi:hypothetical protein